MREIQGIIERVSRLNEHYQRLYLTVEDFVTEIKPGQSLLARLLPERWDPYLREHWWPVGLLPNAIVVERPASIIYEPGQVVSLLGLVGQPFRYKRNVRHVLLIAYDTAPSPLIMSMSWLQTNGVNVTMVLSGKATQYPTQHLHPEVEIIRADEELNWSNRVLTISWADHVYAVAGEDDEIGRFGKVWETFKTVRAEIPKSYLFGVFQSALPCGTGACQACMIPLQHGNTCLSCLDGPAVDLTSLPFAAS